jgi:hypothetical protein
MDYIFTHKEYLDDTEITDLYHDVVENELQDILFYDGGTQNVEDWLRFVNIGAWLVRVDTKDGRPAGMFWLNGFQGRAAQIHFCTWRSHLDKKGAGLASLKWIKDQTSLSGLYGCTPKHYRLVFKLIQEVGFQLLGELPAACYIAKQDKYVPGIISVLDLTKIEGD